MWTMQLLWARARSNTHDRLAACTICQYSVNSIFEGLKLSMHSSKKECPKKPLQHLLLLCAFFSLLLLLLSCVLCSLNIFFSLDSLVAILLWEKTTAYESNDSCVLSIYTHFFSSINLRAKIFSGHVLRSLNLRKILYFLIEEIFGSNDGLSSMCEENSNRRTWSEKCKKTKRYNNQPKKNNCALVYGDEHHMCQCRHQLMCVSRFYFCFLFVV